MTVCDGKDGTIVGGALGFVRMSAPSVDEQINIAILALIYILVVTTSSEQIS